MKTFNIGAFSKSFSEIDFGLLADMLLWLNKNVAPGKAKLGFDYVWVNFIDDEDAVMFFLKFSEQLELTDGTLREVAE